MQQARRVPGSKPVGPRSLVGVEDRSVRLVPSSVLDPHGVVKQTLSTCGSVSQIERLSPFAQSLLADNLGLLAALTPSVAPEVKSEATANLRCIVPNKPYFCEDNSWQGIPLRPGRFLQLYMPILTTPLAITRHEDHAFDAAISPSLGN